MKKVLFSALATVLITASSFATDAKKVNTKAANVFVAEFKDAKSVNWTSTTNYVKASFTLDNKNMEAFYDMRGNMIGTSTAISLEELPTNAKRSLAKKLDGYTVKEAIQFDGTDETAYYVSAENDTQSLLLKVSEDGFVMVFKQTKR